MKNVDTDYEHPAFPQPADLSATIWRYITFDKLESLATSRSLYMRRADKFPDDEFEATTPAGDIAAWHRAAENAVSEEERATIIHNREELAEYAKVFRQNYFISCWHMAPEENVAMWDRYTKGTIEAVTVRTTYSTLKGQLPRAVVNFGMVRYIDYDLEQLPSINMLERITHKRHFYRDEREVRAVMCAISPDPIRDEYITPYMAADGFGYAPPVDVHKLVEAVILHPRATRDFAAKVATLCARHGQPAPIASRMSGEPQF
jgi:hypothetical protein